MFGGTDAFCSPFIVRDNSVPCYHCNRYGLKQASCTRYIRCVICSKGHHRLVSHYVMLLDLEDLRYEIASAIGAIRVEALRMGVREG
jgi:hypothetical protein